MFKNIFYYLLLLFFTCQSAFSGEDVFPRWDEDQGCYADCYTPPKLHPASQPRPGQRNSIINVSTHDINFYNRFMATPLHHIEVAKQAVIQALRERLPISPGLYEADYRDLRDLFFDAYLGDILLRDEQAPLPRASYEGISKSQRPRSAQGLTPEERKRLVSIQSPRMNLTSETIYGDVVVGPALNTLITRQKAIVEDASRASIAFSTQLHTAGHSSLREAFGQQKNYAHLMLAVVVAEEGIKKVYGLNFPGIFSSGTTPLAIPGTRLVFDDSGIVGLDIDGFSRKLYFLDAVFPKEVARAHAEMNTLPIETRGPFGGKDLMDKTTALEQTLFRHAQNHFPVATRAMFSDHTNPALPLDFKKAMIAYEHSEQSLEKVIEHLNWIPQRLSRFKESHPRAHILGVMKLVATLRDACSNCAREMYYKAGYSLGYEGRLLRERIPFGVVVSGFESYKQHTLINPKTASGAGTSNAGKTEERFTTGKGSRDVDVVYTVDSLNLMGQPFMTYMG
jgi:hypothetical protein